MMLTPKQEKEKSLLQRMCAAWSLTPEDATRELRTPKGKLQTYGSDSPAARAVYVAHLRKL